MGSHTPFSNNRDNVEQQEQHSFLFNTTRLFVKAPTQRRKGAKIFRGIRIVGPRLGVAVHHQVRAEVVRFFYLGFGGVVGWGVACGALEDGVEVGAADAAVVGNGFDGKVGVLSQHPLGFVDAQGGHPLREGLKA